MLMEGEHNIAREDKEGSGMEKESMGSSPELCWVYGRGLGTAFLLKMR
jgi:hypothetical protein